MDGIPDIIDTDWINQGGSAIWAPDVVPNVNGGYTMYFSASAAASPSQHCVGAAHAENITGPYIPQKDALVCPISKGGAIDAAHFTEDDGSQHLVYKIDANSIGKRSCLAHIALESSGPNAGMATTGDSTTLICGLDSDRQRIVEAPYLIKRNGQYTLLFSASWYADSTYNTAYATSSSLLGPYTRAPGSLIQTGDFPGVNGPGGMSVERTSNLVVFHNHEVNNANTVVNKNKAISDDRAMWTGWIQLAEDGSWEMRRRT